LRHLRWCQKALETSRKLAKQSILEKIGLAGIDGDNLLPARRHIRQNVAACRSDPSTAMEIESRLLANQVDTSTIDLETIVQSRDLCLLFDTLLGSALNRRILLLREIENRRCRKPS